MIQTPTKRVYIYRIFPFFNRTAVITIEKGKYFVRDYETGVRYAYAGATCVGDAIQYAQDAIKAQHGRAHKLAVFLAKFKTINERLFFCGFSMN